MLPFLYFTNAISITLFRNRHKRKHRNITNFAARWGRCPLGHKDGHQGFHPCESRFLYFLVWRRSESGDRFEIGERQRIFTSVSFSTCSQCQIPFCYTGRLLPAGAAYPCRATRKSGVCGQHLRIRCSVQFSLAGAVRYNVPRICATRVCRACADLTVCVAVRCL